MNAYYKVSWKNTKKFFLIFFMILGVSMAQAIDINSGLMLHYTFEDLTSGVVSDESGNGNESLLMGDVLAVEGKTGDAAKLTTVADYVQMPEGLIGTLKSFTIATWVKLDSRNMWSRIFDFGSGEEYNMFLTPHGAESKIRFAIKNGGGEQLIDGVQCPLDQWVHIAVVLDYDDLADKGVVSLYLDGSVVGTNSNVTIYPALLPTSTQNYLGKSQYPDPALNGALDDFRIYNRAMDPSDILVLAGMPGELISTYEALNIELILKDNDDADNVESDLNLPSALDHPEVTIEWTSNATAFVDIDGTVVVPEKYPVAVTLQATLTQIVDEKAYVLTKEFIVEVPSTEDMPDEIATWDFSGETLSVNGGVINVTDQVSGYVGTVMNSARIRTIGESDRFNVLDLGPDNGYFDMGEEIGEAIYALSDYTICGYFYIDESYTQLNNDGNFYWTFSNTDDVMTERNGYIIGSLKAQSNAITATYYGADNSVGVGKNAPQGAWHHIAYVQNGLTGTIYIDGEPVLNDLGEQIATGTVSKLPKMVLRQPDRNGTLYNWLGRSNYVADSYLRNTLLYDFRVFAVPLSPIDLFDYVGVAEKLDQLNNAYAENSDYISDDLGEETDNLTLGDLSAVTSNITLPSKGTISTDITIVWKSSNTAIISNEGVVSRPDYFDYSLTLTATLIKDGQSLSKDFEVTVLAKEGTAFQNDLMVHYDFSERDENGYVIDQAEKHFKGFAKEGAVINKIGESTVYNVLQLGDSIGYFDMGEGVGQVMYNLSDYTISAYFRIDDEYEELDKAGNFLWTFSNSQDIHSDPSGYIIGILNSQRFAITPNRWDGEQAVEIGFAPMQGSWHHLAYTQEGEIGTLYMDGMPMAINEVTLLPKDVLPKVGKLGTPYNWIGRSCYGSDAYLRQTLVYDFRIYRKALAEEDFYEGGEMDVLETIAALDAAYDEFYDGLPSISQSKYKVYSVNNSIIIEGLTGNEQVAIYNIAGQRVKMSNQSNITSVQSGIYVVRIGDSASKILVR